MSRKEFVAAGPNGSPAAGLNGSPAGPRFGDKKSVAAMISMSTRSVDNLMREGLPHLKIGPRRCRFDLQECADWLREHYRVQRRGPATSSTRPVLAAK